MERTGLGYTRRRGRSQERRNNQQPVQPSRSDRDRPGYYFSIIEFDSYEEAMENSNRPETSEFAAQMAKLCDGPPTFRNLDVVDTM